MKYRAFTRNWWKDNPDWPNGLEPQPNGHRSYFPAEFKTEQEAQDFCRAYNATHDPGRYSNKAEYEST